MDWNLKVEKLQNIEMAWQTLLQGQDGKMKIENGEYYLTTCIFLKKGHRIE
jgi:hypothetical protein